MKEDRFQIYKKALEEQPDCAAAVRGAEAQENLPFYARLYLHTFAPVIVKFAGWVLDEAVRTGKKRLYFLSRDGYQPYLAACRLAERRRLKIECRYLHVSRYCLRVPAYHLDMKSGLKQICAGGIDVTPEKLLKRGALTDAECMEVAERLGLQKCYRHILSRRQLRQLKQILEKETVFLRYVEQHSGESYAAAMGYLAQEGLLSDIPYAIVDSGWVGTLQQTMELLVQSKRPQLHVEGYYFGLYEIPAGTRRDAYHTYYFAPCSGLQRKVHFSNSFFEAVCSADEGMTLGYLQKDGSFLPRQEAAGLNREHMQWSQKALELFLHHYEEKQEKNAEKRMTEKLFTALMSCPSKLEADSFGDIRFSDDVREDGGSRLAAELTEAEIKNQHILRKLCIVAGLKKAVIHESAWMEGSIVKNGIRKGKDGRRYIKKELFQIRLQKYLIYARKQIKSGKKRK
ncbi:MAG: hypothetical protein HDR08_00300 [Lachnospiraceae bacterium]|nr:hypothetical protein [Lachnospiraceae bacterium]